MNITKYLSCHHPVKISLNGLKYIRVTDISTENFVTSLHHTLAPQQVHWLQKALQRKRANDHCEPAERNSWEAKGTGFGYPNTPWDWHIYLYEWLIFMVNAGKYTIHGSYGVYRGLYYLVIYGGEKNHQPFQVPKMEVQKPM